MKQSNFTFYQRYSFIFHDLLAFDDLANIRLSITLLPMKFGFRDKLQNSIIHRALSQLFRCETSTYRLFLPCCSILHFTLLAFNALAIKILSSISGGSKSVFANKRNAVALLLVASQVKLEILIITEKIVSRNFS